MSDVEKQIKEILENDIRPALAMDGGDVVFKSYKDGVLSVQLRGACGCCPHSQMTLKMGIEARLKESVAELKEVVSV